MDNEDKNDINFMMKDSEEEQNVSYYVDNPRTYKRPRRRRGFFSYFIVALVAAIIGGTITAYIAPTYLYGSIMPTPKIFTQNNKAIGEQITITPKDNITAVTAVAKKAMNSVVGITTIQTVREFIFEKQIQGVGSGVIVNKNGYILTNSHVVDDGYAERITVLFEDGAQKKAEVLWNDSALDLAIIKVDATNLPIADFGDSDKLEVGELAVAIGNPLGLEFQRTVTSGVISGLNRSIRVDAYNQIDDLIQTDASINPGNSGGPLLNAKGEVIGINTAKISAGEGLGFAIPINIAKPIVDQVISRGDFKSVVIGIVGVEVQIYERQLGIDLKADEGIIIVETSPNSAAERAGIKPGDVIIKIDDQKIAAMDQLRRALYNYQPGDSAKVTIMRNGQIREVEVTFKETK